MERLSPLDAAFLAIEDEDPQVSLAIASLAIVAGPAPSPEQLAAAVAARLPRVPRYRQKIRRVPLDLGAPVWVDDDSFDPAAHVERLSVPQPHDQAALCELVASLMAERLDRDRPLWRFWVLDGLSGGRWALLAKVHHCMADGVSAAGLQQLLFGETASTTQADPHPDPGALRVLASSLADLVTGPFAQAGALACGLLHPRALARRTTDVARGFSTLAQALMPVSPSSLGGPISGPCGYAIAQAELSGVTAIAEAFTTTVNDVLLAAITGGLREILLRHGEEPSADSVRSLVPVSVRLPGDPTLDNEVSLLLPLLPVDLPDPAQRLVQVHRRLLAHKEGKEATAGRFMTATAARGPFAPAAWAVRAGLRLPRRNVVTVTTNVPGPAETLAIAGHKVLALYPYVPIAVGLRTGIAMLTYRGRVFFGVTTDRATVPDPRVLADATVADLTALKAAAVSSSRARSSSPGSGSNRRSVPKPKRT
ncbi:wax ester/triacylglycerol synthase family O-acyltransferase [Amycolatopsis panacis]|uniref:Diacylglycerol O-acyltransferase n=1 Tax=Amycolatopsis panacis TaxID=2340917 RepID=A0A419I6S7_9PSEU|nr:wax ester/triacylglycerol synthase family O-acyltransferase [Amycolatopsis panacis]RJQ87241.1 wax ester/triacylglycerol synthase family O-acyltransferase [Amycolatopsis panacis]